MTFTDNCKLIVDGMAKGNFAFGVSIGSCGRDLDRLIRQGVPAKRLYKPFKKAPALSGGAAGNNIQCAKNAPHPNAAKLFINWFLSKEGQTLSHTISKDNPDPNSARGRSVYREGRPERMPQARSKASLLDGRSPVRVTQKRIHGKGTAHLSHAPETLSRP